MRARDLARLEARVDRDLATLAIYNKRKARAASIRIAEERLKVQILNGVERELKDEIRGREKWIALNDKWNRALNEVQRALYGNHDGNYEPEDE